MPSDSSNSAIKYLEFLFAFALIFNFGIIPPLENRVKGGKVAKYAVYAERALAALEDFKEKYENHN